MDIRHLRNMLAVMEEGSIGKASQRLHISQPALTKSIQRLEEHLGVRLFDREARGMKPTFYADSLRGYAKAACVGMAEAESQIASLRNGTEGIITVAGPPLIVTELLPDVLLKLSQERPKLQVHVVARNRDLFTDLLEGRFNLWWRCSTTRSRNRDCRSSGCSTTGWSWPCVPTIRWRSAAR
jgi:DNA-binding transcriptional LysR family regulator